MSPTFYRLQYTSDSASQIRRVQKALFSRSGNILFSADWLKDTQSFLKCRQEVVQQGREISLIIPHKNFIGAKSEFVDFIRQNFSKVIITFDPYERTLSSHLDALYESRDKVLFQLDFQDNFDIKSFFSNLPIWIRQQIYFHPCTLKLKAKQIYEMGRTITSLFPEVQFLPVPGLDQFDLRIADAVALVPDGELKFRLHSAAPNIKISVIIPTYENQEYLLNCIRHLLNQSLNRNEFEVVIVDDGSPNLNLVSLENFLMPEMGHCNLSYFFLPKKMIPESFFGNFRAGLCRNFGVRHSYGEAITFLDSDMIVPSDFLLRTLKHLEQTDLIQSVREHIHPSKSDRFTSYEQMTKKHLFIEEKNYWGPFFSAQDWMSIPDFWKYTCTYSLSMKRSFFERMGQFRKSYVSYGFEDTDFGYQAFKQGARFYLDKTPIYHLTPYADKSRYRHSMFYKHQLLRLTAKTFYVNSLSPDIFAKMKTFMD